MKLKLSKNNVFCKCFFVAKDIVSKGLGKFDSMICKSVPSFIFLLFFSFAINIFLEAALRKSFSEAFGMVISDPLVFGLNFLIVLASFTLIFFFRRRAFAFSLISIYKKN